MGKTDEISVDLSDEKLICDKVFINGPSKVCGGQSFKNLKCYGLLSHMIMQMVTGLK